jgi:TPP-dependent pyruvate/acetoin dehydrogenase alpha subunit
MTAASPDGLRLHWYREMLRIRVFEDRVLELFQAGRMPGTVHQYQGQEAVAVGACAHLEQGDFVTSTHRSHGHAIAKGLTMREVAAELFAKAPGCCRGKGGSMHMGNIERGMLPAIAIVAGGIPIAAGLALSQQMKGTDRVTVCFFGDGAVGHGAFHEGVNLAAVWRLPLVLVCENNLYAASTRFDRTSPVPHVAIRAQAYGIRGVTVDGMDVEAVADAADEAIAQARAGGGPTLLECETYRFCGHSRSDRNNYRDDEEERRWLARDPILLQRKRLLEVGALSEDALAQMESDVRAEVEDALAFAEAADNPARETLWSDVFAPGKAGAPPYWPGAVEGGAR